MSKKFKGGFKLYISNFSKEVTGSRIFIVFDIPYEDNKCILIDCGYFQEVDYRYLNYVDDIDPRNVEVILITHNHIDHTGLLPKFIRQGFTGKIYMTKITQELIGPFLYDICDLQEENCNYIQNKYPEYKYMFRPLFDKDDVAKTLDHCVGMDYRRRFDLFSHEDLTVAVTFYENGHILGSSMVLVECKYYGFKAINFLFTGDYRLENVFYDVPPLPERVKNMELILVHEATYGTTTSRDIKKCFNSNMKEAFHRRQSILIGAFAQGRMQEILYRLKLMQDNGEIPEDYEIIVDGNLGITTTEAYKRILSWYNPSMADFMPKCTYIDAKSREQVLGRGHPVIVVTTSGMLSNGPARVYVPLFIEHSNAMIHLCGYAAEETLARTLLDARYNETVTIGGKVHHKRATIKTTREFTSHITLDEMISFINQFTKVQFLAVNHGEKSVKDFFVDYVADSCPNVKMTDVLDRDTLYCIYQFGRSGEKFGTMSIKKLPSHLDRFEPQNCRSKKNRPMNDSGCERCCYREDNKRKGKKRSGGKKGSKKRSKHNNQSGYKKKSYKNNYRNSR